MSRTGAFQQLSDLIASLPLEELRREWDLLGKKLRAPEFLKLMHRFAATRAPEDEERELQWAAAALELFGQMDPRGEGALSWDDFSNFVMGLDLLEQPTQDDDKRVREYRRVADGKMNDDVIFRKIQYLPAVDRLFAIPQKEELVHIVTPTVPPRISSTLRHHTAYRAHAVLCALGIPATNFVLTSSMTDQSFLTLWSLPQGDDYQKTKEESSSVLPVLVTRVETEEPQSALLFSQSRVYSGSLTSGFVYEWELTRSAGRGADMDGLRLRKSVRLHMFGVTSLVELDRRKTDQTTLLISGSTDGYISVWEDWNRLVQLSAQATGPGLLVLSQDHGLLFAAGRPDDKVEGTHPYPILVWTSDGHSFRPAITTHLDRHVFHVTDMAEVPRASQLVTSDASGHVVVWSLPSLRITQQFFVPSTTAIAWLPLRLDPPPDDDDATVMTATTTGTVVVEKQSAVALLVSSSEAGAVLYRSELHVVKEPVVGAFYDGNTSLFVVISTQSVCVWDAKTGHLKSQIDAGTLLGAKKDEVTPEFVAACLSGSGRKLVLADDRGDLHLCAMPPGGNRPYRVKALDPHDGTVTSLHFLDISSSAGAVLSGGTDGIVGVHDEAASGYRPAEPGVHPGKSVRVRDVQLFAMSTLREDSSRRLRSPPSVSRSPPRRTSMDSNDSETASNNDDDSDSAFPVEEPTPWCNRRNASISELHHHQKEEHRVTQEVVLATADVHLNLVATLTQCGETPQLSIWDFELFSLHGTCDLPIRSSFIGGTSPMTMMRKDPLSKIPDAANWERVTGAAFLSPYPVLAACTSKCVVHLWKVPQCVTLYTLDVVGGTFITQQPHETNNGLAMMSAATRKSDAFLAAGTDRSVLFWGLEDAFFRGVGCIRIGKVRRQTYNPLRAVHAEQNTSTLKRAHRRRSQVLQTTSKKMPITFRMWQVHDELTFVKVIRDFVVTGFDDGKVRIWTSTAQLLGQLDVNAPRGIPDLAAKKTKRIKWTFESTGPSIVFETASVSKVLNAAKDPSWQERCQQRIPLHEHLHRNATAQIRSWDTIFASLATLEASRKEQRHHSIGFVSKKPLTGKRWRLRPLQEPIQSQSLGDLLQMIKDPPKEHLPPWRRKRKMPFPDGDPRPLARIPHLRHMGL